jgi:hypothetical protein
MKAYVHSYDPQPESLKTSLKMKFCVSRENAFSWKTREEAEVVFRRIEEEYSPITIDAAGGAACKGFEVEERAPGEFVIFCEYPSMKVEVDKTYILTDGDLNRSEVQVVEIDGTSIIVQPLSGGSTFEVSAGQLSPKEFRV